MDNIDIDSSNPFLYVAGFSLISVMTNIYCCYRRCKNNQKLEIESNIELTKEFRNVINDINENVILPEMKDEETVIDVKILDEPKESKETTETTTQTEDCQLYEMMGQRFNDELDFYKNAVINKNKNNKKFIN